MPDEGVPATGNIEVDVPSLCPVDKTAIQQERQRAYRQRSRAKKKNEMLALEEDFKRKLEQLTILERQNQHLKARTRALEVALTSSDLTLSSLQHTQQSTGVATLAPSPASMPPAAQAISTFPPASSNIKASSPSNPSSEHHQQLTSPSDNSIPAPSSSTCVFDSTMLTSAKPLSCYQDALQYYKDVISQLARLLVAYDAASEAERAPIQQQIAAVVQQDVANWLRFGMHQPGASYQLDATNLETGQLEQPADSYWAQLAGQAQLEQHELKHLAACHDIFEPRLQRVMQQRALVTSQLQQISGAGGLANVLAAGADGSQAPAAAPVADAGADPHELVLRVQRLMKVELALELMMGVCAMQLMPWHKVARSYVHCWPYAPSARLLLRSVKQRYEQQQQVQEGMGG